MWHRLLPLLPPDRTIVTYDMRGFGNSPEPPRFSHARDLIAVLERLEPRPATVVGASLGGRVALEAAGERPDLVERLVLLASATIGHDWSQAMRDYDEAEEAAIEAGDIDRAVELSVEMWVRDPSVKDLVATMQRRAYELQLAGEAEEEDQIGLQLDRIEAPTTIVDGELDLPDFAVIADELAARIRDATRHTVEGAGHLIALEKPHATAALI